MQLTKLNSTIANKEYTIAVHFFDVKDNNIY
jgi:hypothetical protein